MSIIAINTTGGVIVPDLAPVVTLYRPVTLFALYIPITKVLGIYTAPSNTNTEAVSNCWVNVNGVWKPAQIISN